MVRTFLSAGLVLLAGCSIPSTLGLPCEDNSHCDPGQICEGDVCEMGRPGDTMMTMPLPTPTSAGTTDESATSTSDATASSTSEDASSSSTTASEESVGSTGPACGVDACNELDVLLVVDNSDSMSQWLIPLSNSLADLFALFEQEFSGVCSYHIGIANAEQMPQTNTPECQFPGALLQRLDACDGAPGDPPYYSNESGVDTEDVFGALQCTFINQGFGGDEDERMIDSMLGALNPDNNAEGACNDGFRRPNANLAILYISDENDPTPSDEQDTAAELFLSYVDPSLVVFIGVVGDPSNRAPECQWVPDGEEGTGAETPSALSGFLALSGIPLSQQARVDICQTRTYQFDEAFEVFGSICR